ncbi:hypothetical protein DIPPA_24411 [Diplonema papillatum]|nr:hypothetical protein DIPPA_24411 [Diplonema papillatum]|eukprot:gene9089-14081_t
MASGPSAPHNPYAGASKGAKVPNPYADAEKAGASKGVKVPNPYADAEKATGGSATVHNPYGQTGGAPCPEAAARQKQAMLEKLNGVLQKHNITIVHADDLLVLLEYDVVLICDDSGSMQCSAVPANSNAPPRSRWEELKRTVAQIIEIASCLDDNGIDIHFLNRDSIYNVPGTEDSRFIQAFSKGPSGSTPLVGTLERVVKETKGTKPVLLVAATDGAPNEGARAFERSVRGILDKSCTPHTFKIQVMVCTPNDSEVEWLNTLDCKLDGFDVTDDYESEKRQVLKMNKKLKVFRKSDYIVKALLGPILTRFDRQDEGKHDASSSSSSSSSASGAKEGKRQKLKRKAKECAVS